MNINQSKKNNNKSTEDKQGVKNNVRAQEIVREKAGGGSMNLRDISACLQWPLLLNGSSVY